MEVLGSLGSVAPADEFFAVTGVSFFTNGCAVGALSGLLTDGTSRFETESGGVCPADGSWV